MALDTGLFTPLINQPALRHHLVLSYEGPNQGGIRLRYNRGQTMMMPGDVMIVEMDDATQQSLIGGEIRGLIDPARWNGSPPLFTYRLRHIV